MFLKKCEIRASGLIVSLLNCTLGPPNYTLWPPNLGVMGTWAHGPPGSISAWRTLIIIPFCDLEELLLLNNSIECQIEFRVVGNAAGCERYSK